MAKNGPVKLGIGSGPIQQEGWLSSDVDSLDVRSRAAWKAVFGKYRADAVLAEHIFEHLSEEEGRVAFANCFSFMEAGGHLRIAVPDGNHGDPDYIDHVRPGGTGLGADDHRILYTRELLEEMLQSVGFRTYALEYWEKDGGFVHIPWDDDDGRVRRSFHHDPRNEDGKPNYTSLIVDGVKPPR